MTNIERIINPEESLEEIKETLIGLYKEQYSSKYSDLIKDKINNGIYFFESTPDLTFNFLLRYTKDYSNIEKIYTEYEDYINKRQEINQDLINYLFQMYVIAFNLSRYDITRLMNKKESFISLPIEAYYDQSAHSQNIAKKAEYIKMCEELGINPIYDNKTIECLLKARANYGINSNTRLIKETIWGQRINSEFNKITNAIISPEVVANIIYGYPCYTQLTIASSQFENILYIPLIRQYHFGEIDTTFFHETRHMIEDGDNGDSCGLDCENGEYKILNELRVEKHAIEDNQKTDVIFSKRVTQEDVYLPYRMLFPLADDFIESYESYLDELAITQNVAKLELTFGSEDIKGYGQFLSQAYDIIINSNCIQEYRCSEGELQKSKEYIKKIKKNVESSIN